MGKQHLTYEKRLQIEALFNKAKMKPAAIAEALGYSRQTIYSELRRGYWLRDMGYHDRKEYSAQKAQAAADKAKANYRNPIKYDQDPAQMQFIQDKIIKEKYSPAAALAEARKSGYTATFCVNTIYRYIDQKIFPKLRNHHLPEKVSRKRQAKYASKKVRRIPHITLPSIEHRPQEINQRNEPGHWEMDLVCCTRNSKAALLVLIERSRRSVILRKIPDKQGETIIREMNRIEKETPDFEHCFRSITTDNGSEFLQYEKLCSSINGGKRFEIYYCHSYCAWEKGSVENVNRMIRRWIPKGKSIEKLDPAKIQLIEKWLNGYPRKILGWEAAKA